MKISQNFVAFSEYMNFTKVSFFGQCSMMQLIPRDIRRPMERFFLLSRRRHLQNAMEVVKGSSFFKVHIFWEGHKILRNLHLTFDCMYCSQKLGEDVAKFCCLLRMYELYVFWWADCQRLILGKDVKERRLKLSWVTIVGKKHKKKTSVVRLHLVHFCWK